MARKIINLETISVHAGYGLIAMAAHSPKGSSARLGEQVLVVVSGNPSLPATATSPVFPTGSAAFATLDSLEVLNSGAAGKYCHRCWGRLSRR
eukprot:6204145-Pleurochrysis_carterae.AAC.6